MNSKLKELVIWLIMIIVSCIGTITVCTSCIGEKDLSEKKDLEGTLTSNDAYEGWEYCNFYINYVVETKMSIDSDEIKHHWIVYDNIDAGFDNAVISMDEGTFTLLLEALDALQDVELYSQEWKEISDRYEFVILYKDKTNILMAVDKD